MPKKVITMLCLALAFIMLFPGCLAISNSLSPSPSPSEEIASNTPSEEATPSEEPTPSETTSPEATPSPTETTPNPTESAPLQTETPAPEPSPAETPLAELAPTLQMSFQDIIRDDGTREKPPTADSMPSKSTYRMVIDLKNQIMIIYTKGDTGGYDKPVRYMLCSTGKPGYNTPAGVFHIGSHKVRFGFFVDFDCYAQYWTQVVNSIYIHSILYGSRDDKHLKTSSYRQLGRAVSHGCVRLLPPDAKWVYENIAPGTECEITSKLPANPDLKAKLKPPPIS